MHLSFCLALGQLGNSLSMMLLFLSKELLEVFVYERLVGGQAGQGSIVPHGAQGLLPGQNTITFMVLFLTIMSCLSCQNRNNKNLLEE